MKKSFIALAGLGALITLVGANAIIEEWRDRRALESRRAELRTEWQWCQANPEPCEQRKAVEQAELAAEQDSQGFDSEEIDAFLATAQQLDPGSNMFEVIDIEPGSPSVEVTGTIALFTVSELQLKEFGLEFRNAASKTCECVPSVTFSTAAGQRVMIADSNGVRLLK